MKFLFRGLISCLASMLLIVSASADTGAPGFIGGQRIDKVTENCIVYATAGGTGDAITIPLMLNPMTPCRPNATLLGLTLTATNSTTTPTLQPFGFSPEVIVNADGSALSAAQLASGTLVMLANDGTRWRIVSGKAGGGGSSISLSGSLPIVVTPDPFTSGSGVVSVNNATTSTVGVVEPDNTTISIASGIITAITATSSTLGIVRPDNTSISISGGILSSVPKSCLDLVAPVGTACQANTGTSGHTVPFLDGNNIWSGSNQFAETLGAGRTSSATTDTLAASDCGTTVFYTSNSAVTVTIPASIVPANNIVCYMNIAQMGTAKVSVNGSAVTPATLVSELGFTGTSGTQYAIIGLTLSTVSSVTLADLTGSGS